MTILLDSSVLIALNVGDHVHNGGATTWFTASDEAFATCPITQGALLRHLMRADWLVEDAIHLLELLSSSPRHEFWPDDISYQQVQIRGIMGHRQLTDAYIASLARQHGGRLATFDKGFAALHKDVAQLVPMS